MCVDPVQGLLAGANVGFSLFGASQSARGAARGAQQGAMQSLLAAQIADANARMAMIEASGRISAVDRKVDAVIGHNVADAAARGLDPNQGSPLLDQAYVEAQGNIDKKLIAGAALTEKASLHYAAAGEMQKGGDALAAAKYGAGTAWLGGLRSALSSAGGLKWGSFKEFSQGISSFGADLASAYGG